MPARKLLEELASGDYSRLPQLNLRQKVNIIKDIVSHRDAELRQGTRKTRDELHENIFSENPEKLGEVNELLNVLNKREGAARYIDELADVTYYAIQYDRGLHDDKRLLPAVYKIGAYLNLGKHQVLDATIVKHFIRMLDTRLTKILKRNPARAKDQSKNEASYLRYIEVKESKMDIEGALIETKSFKTRYGKKIEFIELTLNKEPTIPIQNGTTNSGQGPRA